MKKVFYVTLALVLALVLLASCTSYGEALNKVSDLLKQDYSKLTVSVTSVRDGLELTALFNVEFGEKTTVNYTVKEMSKLNIEGGNPDSYINEYSGSAVVENGKLTENGKETDLPIEGLNFGEFNFSERNFSDIEATATSLKAKVTDPKGFAGNNSFVASDMKLTALFSAEAISELTVEYTSQNGANVLTVYRFE